MLIDAHAHLNFNAFRDDFNEIIERSLAENIWMINVGTKYETSKRAVEIAEKYEKGIYAAIGLHPIYSTAGIVKIKTDPEEGNFVASREDFDSERYKELAKSEKVVAIGEIGLDYYYKPKTKRKLELFKEKQRTVLWKQLDLVKELNLPVIFHCRMAHEDLLKILKEQRTMNNEQLGGVIHCFTGSWEQAKQYLDMGFYLGLNGIIYKLDLKEVIEKTPLDRILVETDCPYLAPPESILSSSHDREKMKGGRNEPIFVRYIAKEIAKIKAISFEKVSQATFKNTTDLFSI